MKLVENVFEIAESFMSNPKYVALADQKIESIADKIKKTKKPVFSFPDKNSDAFPIIVKELVAASINYCYWYGRDTIRPNGASSTLMYELLLNCFYDFEYGDKEELEQCISRLCRVLAIYRFPLLEDRIRHLKELMPYATDFCIMIHDQKQYNQNLEYLLLDLVENFPGFASDIFLKRASLFFIQLHRRFGWFNDELKNLHVPADYQVPKMLEHFGCIRYDTSLRDAINNNELIQKGSVAECEIRAATILAIKKLCDLTGWNVAEVDAYFFLKRHEVQKPFHLTITTDY